MAVLGILVVAGLTWQLGYKLALGIPVAVTPAPGPDRHVFLIATEAIQYLPVLAELGAIGLLLATGRFVPPCSSGRRGPTRLAATVTAALGAHVLTMAAIMLTGRPGLWMGARTLVVLLLIVLVAWAFIESVRATRHIRVPLVSVAPVAGSSDRRI